MSNWKETFELCDKSKTFLANLTPGPVVSCTRTFSFLPLRYGAVGGTASQRGQLPFLSAYFSQPSKVGRLSESAYALRPLRAHLPRPLFLQDGNARLHRQHLHR